MVYAWRQWCLFGMVVVVEFGLVYHCVNIQWPEEHSGHLVEYQIEH